MKYSEILLSSDTQTKDIALQLKDMRADDETDALALVSYNEAGLPNNSRLKGIFKLIPKRIQHLYLPNQIVQQLADEHSAEVYSAIPSTVHSLHVGNSSNHINLGTAESHLERMLKSIPHHIRAVSLQKIDFRHDSKDALIRLFAAVPHHVNSISFIDFQVGDNGKALEDALKNIPSQIRTLELNFSSIQSLLNSGIANAIKAIPAHVTTLKIPCNGNRPIATLIQFLKQAPSWMTTLDLSGIDLWCLHPKELSLLCAAIPPSITNINLSNNDGLMRFLEAHGKALQRIPEQVKSMSLANNHLGNLDNDSFVQMLKSLPLGIKTLNLSENQLYRKTPAGLIRILSAIPSHVDTLDISGNLFLLRKPYSGRGRYYIPKTKDELTRILKAIPKHITTLRIANDVSLTPRAHGELFKNAEVIRFEDVIQELPEYVTTLDLSNNQFGDLTLDELVSLIKAIPSTVKHIVLRDNYLFHGKSIKERNDILNALLPFSSNGRLDISFNGEAEFARVAATSLINAAPQLPMDVWNHIIGTYLLPGTPEKKPTQKIKSAQCHAFLNELEFDQYLDKFRAKRDLIKNKPCYEKALSKFNELITQLEARKDNFIKQNNSSRQAKDQFKIYCLSDIAKAKSVLIQHRGWKKFFADLLSVFCSVLSAGLANRITGKSIFGLFPVKTDSQEKIESFENQLNKNKPGV